MLSRCAICFHLFDLTLRTFCPCGNMITHEGATKVHTDLLKEYRAQWLRVRTPRQAEREDWLRMQAARKEGQRWGAASEVRFPGMES